MAGLHRDNDWPLKINCNGFLHWVSFYGCHLGDASIITYARNSMCYSVFRTLECLAHLLIYSLLSMNLQLLLTQVLLFKYFGELCARKLFVATGMAVEAEQADIAGARQTARIECTGFQMHIIPVHFLVRTGHLDFDIVSVCFPYRFWIKS